MSAGDSVSFGKKKKKWNGERGKKWKFDLMIRGKNSARAELKDDFLEYFPDKSKLCNEEEFIGHCGTY